MNWPGATGTKTEISNMEIEIYKNISDPMTAIERIGTMFAKSGMFGCDKIEQGQVLAMICLTERKSPVEISKSYDIIGGKLRKKSMAAYAEFRAKGARVKWIKTGDDGVEAKAEVLFEGNTVVCSFTMEQAKRSGIFRAGSAWDKAPGNMLRARVMSNAVGMLAPEIYAGEDDSVEPFQPGPIPAPIPEPAAAPVEKMAKVIKAPPAAPVTVDVLPDVRKSEWVENSHPVIPVKEVPAAPAIAPAAPVASGKSLDELVAELELAIGEHGPAAHKWMVANGWLKEGQGLAALGERKMIRVINQRESFIRSLTNGGGQ